MVAFAAVILAPEKEAEPLEAPVAQAEASPSTAAELRAVAAGNTPPGTLYSLEDGIGGDAIAPAPLSRWDMELAEASGRSPLPRLGSFMRGAEEFDLSLFSVSNKEATLMDVQQRLLLQQSF